VNRLSTKCGSLDVSQLYRPPHTVTGIAGLMSLYRTLEHARTVLNFCRSEDSSVGELQVLGDFRCRLGISTFTRNPFSCYEAETPGHTHKFYMLCAQNASKIEMFEQLHYKVQYLFRSGSDKLQSPCPQFRREAAIACFSIVNKSVRSPVLVYNFAAVKVCSLQRRYDKLHQCRDFQLNCTVRSVPEGLLTLRP
jgi:hypothetical protein